MILKKISQHKNVILPLSILCLCAVGIILRIYNLPKSGFFSYDEGMYENYNYRLLQLTQRLDGTFQTGLSALLIYLRSSLAFTKFIWLFIIDSRFLWGGLHDLWFSKAASAFFGILTLPLVYVFARRLFRSKEIGLTSVLIMALLPSGVFYSRLGLQETASTFFVLAAFYFYVFQKGRAWRTIAAGTLFAAAFFSNYRLIMLPLLMTVVELWQGPIEQQGINARRYVWSLIVFAAWVVLVGSAFGGSHTFIVSAWIFHQEDMAGHGGFSWLNLISYPYYLFRLETVLFTGFFFGNFYFLFKKRAPELLPFVLTITQMVFFTFMSEKGPRYIAVMLPFAAMSAAFCIHRLLAFRQKLVPEMTILGSVLMLAFMLNIDIQLAQASSGHEQAVQAVQKIAGQHVRILSSQPLVDNLYVQDKMNVKMAPPDFPRLLVDYNQGFRYLILDLQSYVGLTASGKHFVFPLSDYLSFIDDQVAPVLVFPHFNHTVLERIVFEDSQNLGDSIRFLNSDQVKKVSVIRVYDLSTLVPMMSHFAALQQQKH